MRIRPPAKVYDPNALAEDVNSFWARTQAYVRVRNSRAEGKKFYLVDGPPFPTAKVHLGMAWNKVLKDCYARFMTATGHNVVDRPGFDMHGLPVEIKVEESLGISYKRQIDEVGVEKFVQACTDFSAKYRAAMTEQFKALGIWMDWEDPYLTSDQAYIESVWAVLKEAHKKNLLVRQKQVTAWCPRCETPLAPGEVVYKEVDGPSVYLKIPIKGKRDEYIVVWTTTPWTFAGCLAIAVHPDYDYARVTVRQAGKKSTLIILESNVEEILTKARVDAYEIAETVKGKQLEKLAFFHPLMADITFHKTVAGDWAHRIIALESVHQSHSGAVYLAPGFGIADARIGAEHGLPLFSPLHERGSFTTEVGLKCAGMSTGEASTSILADMKALRFVLTDSIEPHNFGHCWRCETPIVHRATEQWFVKAGEMRDQMLRSLKGISWTPDGFGSGRQHEWIARADDWCVSRQRYWGTPMPVWECITDVCGHTEVLGSVRDLEGATGYQEGMDIHRPWIDRVSIECPKCGGLMKRSSDIVDVWFDSSAASWAQLGYPRKKKAFKDLWPADLVIEGQDQSKCWFFNQLVSGSLMFGKAPFRKVLAHGHLFDEHGQIDCSKPDSTAVTEILAKHGPDVVRLYMLGIDPREDATYSEAKLKAARGVVNALWNSFVFSATYMSMDGWEPEERTYAKVRDALRSEDAWMLSRIESLSHAVKRDLEAMHPDSACKLLGDFITGDLSRWYIKIVRERIWAEGLTPDKEAAFFTLREVFTRLSVIASPFMPHISETIHQQMLQAELTVSLLPWPETDATRLAEGMERQMASVRQIVSASLKLRQGMGLNLRWPVKKITISCATDDVTAAVRAFSDIIKAQVNVKELEIVPAGQEWAGQELIVVPNPKKIGKAYQLWEMKIAAMLQVLPAKDVKAKIDTGEYVIGIEGAEIKILPDMVEFRTKLPEGIVSSEFPGGVIYFDTTMDDALLAEGFAREIMRRIQQMRRDMGLDPEEFIRLSVKMGDDLLDMLDNWLEKIADSTRATQMEIVDEVTDDEYVVEWPIEEETVVIGATSLNIKRSMDEFLGCREVDRTLAMAIVESGFTSSIDFLAADREQLLKIPGMSHSKLRKIKEYLEKPVDERKSALGDVCPTCSGLMPDGTTYCPRCGRDLAGEEEPTVERIRPESDDTEDFSEQMQREKVRIEKRKKRGKDAESQPEDEIVKMATDGPRAEDAIASEIISDLGEEVLEPPREVTRPPTRPAPQAAAPAARPEEARPAAAVRIVEPEPEPEPSRGQVADAPQVQNAQPDRPVETQTSQPSRAAAPRETASEPRKEPAAASDDRNGHAEESEDLLVSAIMSGVEREAASKAIERPAPERNEPARAPAAIRDPGMASPAPEVPKPRPQAYQEVAADEEIVSKMASDIESAASEGMPRFAADQPARREVLAPEEIDPAERAIQEEPPKDSRATPAKGSVHAAIPEPAIGTASSVIEHVSTRVQASEPDETSKTIDELATLLNVKRSVAESLYDHGYTSMEKVTVATEEELLEIKGIGKVTVRRILNKRAYADEDTKTCSICNAILPATAAICDRCGSAFISGEDSETRELERRMATAENLDMKLSRKPDDVNLLHSKAMTLWDAGRRGEARKLVDDALRISPDDEKLLRAKQEMDAPPAMTANGKPGPGNGYKQEAQPEMQAPRESPKTDSEGSHPPETPAPQKRKDEVIPAKPRQQIGDTAETAREAPKPEPPAPSPAPQAARDVPERAPEVHVSVTQQQAPPVIAQVPEVKEAGGDKEENITGATQSAEIQGVATIAEEEIQISREMSHEGTLPDFPPALPAVQEPVSRPAEPEVPKAPAAEPGADVSLKRSFTYLILEERSARSYSLFKTAMDSGMPAYCVTRTFPEKIRERYALGDITILWLSNVAKEEAVRPKDLEKLSLSLEEFLGKEGGIILLDGIEYLITNNNFITVLKLIQSLRDQVAINRSILLLSINPSTMDSHQINLLKREVDSVIET